MGNNKNWGTRKKTAELQEKANEGVGVNGTEGVNKGGFWL